MMGAYKYVGKLWKTKQSDVVRCLQSVRCYSEYSQHPFILPVAQTSRPAEAHHQLGFNASQKTKFGVQTESVTSLSKSMSSVSLLNRNPWPGLFQRSTVGPSFIVRYITTTGHTKESVSQDGAIPDVVPHIKFKRLDKTAKHIMQILDKEAVQEVRTRREIPDIKPGYIVQLKVEVPENKRRVSVLKGIVIARRNAGLNTTFRLRRLVAGVGVESVFPLYSPNIKEMKVLDKKKVRRAKLYYLRDKMNALKKQ